jgi:hypothetical protein
VISQLAVVGLVLMGAVALSIYGMRHQRGRRGTQPTDGAEGRPRHESDPGEPLSAAFLSKQQVQPIFGAFADEVGRVAEEGVAIHVALGSGGLLSEQGMVSIAALQGLDALVGLSASYDTPPFMTAGDPTLYLLAETRVRSAYARLGSPRSYRSTSVQFVAPSPLLYAAQAATLAADGGLGTNINLGAFDQEVTLLNDAALRKNVKLYGGATSALGLAALYPDVAPDRLIMGEELFAGGAEVVGRSAFWASLHTENLMRLLVVAAIMITVLISFLGAFTGSGG